MGKVVNLVGILPEICDAAYYQMYTAFGYKNTAVRAMCLPLAAASTNSGNCDRDVGVVPKEAEDTLVSRVLPIYTAVEMYAAGKIDDAAMCTRADRAPGIVAIIKDTPAATPYACVIVTSAIYADDGSQRALTETENDFLTSQMSELLARRLDHDGYIEALNDAINKRCQARREGTEMPAYRSGWTPLVSIYGKMQVTMDR